MCRPTVFALRVREVTKLGSRIEGEKEEIDSYPSITDIKNKKVKGSMRCCHCSLGPSPLTNFLDTSEEGTFLVSLAWLLTYSPIVSLPTCPSKAHV